MDCNKRTRGLCGRPLDSFAGRLTSNRLILLGFAGGFPVAPCTPSGALFWRMSQKKVKYWVSSTRRDSTSRAPKESRGRSESPLEESVSYFLPEARILAFVLKETWQGACEPPAPLLLFACIPIHAPVVYRVCLQGDTVLGKQLVNGQQHVAFFLKVLADSPGGFRGIVLDVVA